MTAIASASVPPEWYVVTTLLGLWIGFIGAPWLASRTQGTHHFFRDLGVRFRLIDLVGIAIGVGGQILVAIMYAPVPARHQELQRALAAADRHARTAPASSSSPLPPCSWRRPWRNSSSGDCC